MYKEKLRELKKSCRSIRKRAEEAEKRPELINRLQWSINASLDFVIKIKNLTDEMQIFTDVEINSLVTLVNESMVGGVCNCLIICLLLLLGMVDDITC